MKFSGRLAGFVITFAGAVLFSTKPILVKRSFRDSHLDVISLLSLSMLLSRPFFWSLPGSNSVKVIVNFHKQIG